MRRQSAGVANDWRYPMHEHQEAVEPVVTILDETVAWICSECLARVDRLEIPAMALDALHHPPSIYWLDRDAA